MIPKLDDGKVYFFGRNAATQLGLTGSTDGNSPTLITALNDKVIIDVSTSLSGGFSLVLDGKLSVHFGNFLTIIRKC